MSDSSSQTIASTNPLSQPSFRKFWRWGKNLLAVWIFIKISSCVFLVPGPWGPMVGGELPNGHQVFFQMRPVGRESDKRLIWIDTKNRTRQFWVDQTHAGFEYVVLKYAENGDHVWVETGDAVGASLDLSTGDFRPEQTEKHSWARWGIGQKLAEGHTWRLSWILGPW